MKNLLSVRKRIFFGLISVGFITVLAFSIAVKFSSDYLEAVILNSTFQDELGNIKSSFEKNGVARLPASSHTYGFLGSEGKVPTEFIKYGEGQHHDVYWKQQRFHLFVHPLPHDHYPNDMLYLAIQIEAIERYENKLNIILLFATMSLMVAILWLAYWFTSLISRPVLELSKDVNSLNENDRQLPKPLGDSDLLPIEEAINAYLLKIHEYLTREKMFSGVASHELRTPLSTIRSSLETFLAQDTQEQLSGKQRDRIRRAYRAVVEMQYITESLLFLIKTENEDLHQDTSYQLSELVKELIHEHQVLARSPDIRISYHEEHDSRINLHYQLLKILIGNLLRNALENTLAGEIHITLKKDSILITDSGMGMPEEVTEWVNRNEFEHIQQKHIGIGLFLVVKLCQQIGWKIQVKNHESGKGTSVSLNW